MRIPHPIPYQGSKRAIAKFILPFFPHDLTTLIEPFAGSAAISIAAACYGKARRFHLNDANEPLMALWGEIVNHPERIAENYARLWKEQQGKERAFYDHVRDEFNRTQRPDCLLYLLARCVKASVRYNARGEFNQSPDNRRLGRNPEQMADDIFAVSNLFRGRVIITGSDYREALKVATTKDLVYLDPPYQGVCSTGDPRYIAGVDFEGFVGVLGHLNSREIPFIVSYDGRTGEKSFGKALPSDLGLYQLEVEAGRSTQSTLLGRNDTTYESVYLSQSLIERNGIHPKEFADGRMGQKALQLKLMDN